MLNAPTYEARILWSGPRHFRVERRSTENELGMSGYYVQDTDVLWQTVAQIAAAPAIDPLSLRYLLRADTLTGLAAGQIHAYEAATCILIARTLAEGKLSTQTPPSDEPEMVLNFTIEGSIYSIPLWETGFTYRDRYYDLEHAVLRVVRAEP